MKNRQNAIIYSLIGTAIGDALGLPAEGISSKRIPKLFPDLERYHFIFGKGMISDDTEHTCMVAQAMIAANGNPNVFQKVMGWKLRFWLLGLPAGVGLATLRAIIKLWF